MTDQIGVIGAGAWGTTLAVHLADAQRPVSLRAHSSETAERLAHARTNEPYLPGVVFPPNVRVVTDDAYLGEPHRFYLLAVPSAHVRTTLQAIGSLLDPDAPILSVAKGIEMGTHLRVTQIIDAVLPGRRLGALSGPNLAREVAGGKPAGAVVASTDADLAEDLALVLSSERFRVYT
ncbi:MAG: NAD(P)-binding domain-containing protein, partial [Chloroflexi bacterium]|nr:NAD(P)-binding domain-containing protein [Chloroflexota bacterium]